MDAQHATAFKQKLEHQRAELLAQIAEQRGGKASRVEVAAEHFAHNEDSDAQVNTARDLEFAINEHETAELAAMVPVSGSAYTYTYATLGELTAWFIGWMLVLEYGVSASAVAVSWTGYLLSLLEHANIYLPEAFVSAPLDAQLRPTGAIANVPAALLLSEVGIDPVYALFRDLGLHHGEASAARYGLGLAMGAKLAKPDKLCINVWGDAAIGFVYNRCTDFALAEPGSAALRAAYLDRAVALSPHPRSHALYADKRNLALLGDRTWLQAAGVGPAPDLDAPAALDGLGLAYVPEPLVVDHIAEGRLIAVLDKWCVPFPGYHLYYPNRRQPSPAFSALVAWLRQDVPPTPRI